VKHGYRYLLVKETSLCLTFVGRRKGRTPLHPLAQPLVHEYLDVLPSDLSPGLPPLRGIEHQINLLPRAAQPNMPAYRHVTLLRRRNLRGRFKNLLIKVTYGRPLIRAFIYFIFGAFCTTFLRIYELNVMIYTFVLVLCLGMVL